jgi:hypothetical protein
MLYLKKISLEVGDFLKLFSANHLFNSINCGTDLGESEFEDQLYCAEVSFQFQ